MFGGLVSIVTALVALAYVMRKQDLRVTYRLDRTPHLLVRPPPRSASSPASQDGSPTRRPTPVPPPRVACVTPRTRRLVVSIALAALVLVAVAGALLR